MTTNAGWSSVEADVFQNRFLAELFKAELLDLNQTTSARSALRTAGLTGDPSREAIKLAEAGIVRLDMLTGDGADDKLALTQRGLQLRREFENNQKVTPRKRGARRALLLWLAEQRRNSGAPRKFLEATHSWWYGTQFTNAEVEDAAENLEQRELVTTDKALSGVVGVTLTHEGVACVEEHDGDPAAMDRQTPPATFSIGAITHHGGNSAYGSTNFVQNNATNSADELVKMLHALQELGWLDQLDTEQVGTLADELQTSTTDENRTSAARNIAKFLGSAYEKSIDNPAAQAFLTALGNFVAISAGISAGS